MRCMGQKGAGKNIHTDERKDVFQLCSDHPCTSGKENKIRALTSMN